MKTHKKSSHTKGFSLVELLVVIAVIGVIAAIAIPAMSGIFGKSESAKAARNAQSIVSTFNAARAAGNTTAYANKDAATAAITANAGINGRGSFATSVFAAPMSATERDLADANISLSATDGSGVLILSAAAQQ
jgi:prepilin-type N-terminal cleavage/methylation domain-containing protein